MKITLLLIALSLFTLGCVSPSYSWNSEQSPAQKKLAEQFGFDHMEVGCHKYGVSVTGHAYVYCYRLDDVVPSTDNSQGQGIRSFSKYFDNKNDIWNGHKVWDTFCEPFRPPDF